MLPLGGGCGSQWPWLEAGRSGIVGVPSLRDGSERAELKRQIRRILATIPEEE